MRIKTRMFVGIAGAVMFLLVSNLVAQYVFQQTTETIDQITKVNNKKLETLNNLSALVDERAILFRDLVVYEDDELKKKSRARLKDTSAEIGAILDYFKEQKLQGQEAEFYQQILDNVISANRSFGSFALAADEGFVEEAIDILITEFNPKFVAFAKIVADFKSYQEKQNELSVEKLYEQESFGATALWSVLVVSIVLLGLSGYMVANSFLALPQMEWVDYRNPL